MIKIDDKLSISFVGSNDALNHQFSHLTMRFLYAKMEVGIPFLQAVDEIVTAVQAAVDFHVIANDQELDLEKIKKHHHFTRLMGAVAAANLMYDDDTNGGEDEDQTCRD